MCSSWHHLTIAPLCVFRSLVFWQIRCTWKHMAATKKTTLGCWMWMSVTSLTGILMMKTVPSMRLRVYSQIRIRSGYAHSVNQASTVALVTQKVPCQLLMTNMCKLVEWLTVQQPDFMDSKTRTQCLRRRTIVQSGNSGGIECHKIYDGTRWSQESSIHSPLFNFIRFLHMDTVRGFLNGTSSVVKVPWRTAHNQNLSSPFWETCLNFSCILIRTNSTLLVRSERTHVCLFHALRNWLHIIIFSRVNTCSWSANLHLPERLGRFTLGWFNLATT